MLKLTTNVAPRLARKFGGCFSVFLSLVICVICAAALFETKAIAQEASIDLTEATKLEGKLADKPLAVFYARKVSPEITMNYAKGLAERMNFGPNLLLEMEQDSASERLQDMSPMVSEPLYGSAIYLVAGLIPSLETLAFQQVIDEDDARRLVNGRKRQWGESGTLQERENGCFLIESRNVTSYPLPPDANEADYTSTPFSRRNYKFSQQIVEKDGQKHIEQVTQRVLLLRYHDTFLYEADFVDLFTMELPSADTIRRAAEGTRDFGFEAYLDRIPQGLRQLGWTMLSAAAGSQLQQQDDESETQYNMRRSGGDLGLSLIQTVLFDVDSADGWGRFASAEDDSLRGEVRVRARKNSALGKQLRDSAGTSRFAPLLADNAAATAHVCFRMPEEAVPALQNMALWLVEQAKEDHGDDDEIQTSAATLASVLNEMAEHRTIEIFLKASWTEGSAGAFYGGIHLSETPDLLQQFYFLAQRNSPTDSGKQLTLQERDEIPVLVLQLRENETEQIRAQLGINMTHIYLAHQYSCLWFAAGTEQSFDIIRQSVNSCKDEGGAFRTPLASGRIDMQRWLSYPQTDPSGIAQMPSWLDEHSWLFPPTPLSAFAYNSFNESRKPTPIMQRVFDLGGSQQASFSFEADEGGLLLSASLGEALANHMVARIMDSQERMLQQQQEMIKETEARMKEVQKNREEQRASQQSNE